MLSHYASSERSEYFERHPDTGFVFKGFSIPGWSDVREFVLSSARKLTQFTYLGWDIALTCRGPVAIETNLGFGLDHYQATIGGIREIFNIVHQS